MLLMGHGRVCFLISRGRDGEEMEVDQESESKWSGRRWEKRAGRGKGKGEERKSRGMEGND